MNAACVRVRDTSSCQAKGFRIRFGLTKLVAALLRVARVTAGLSESNGSLPPGL